MSLKRKQMIGFASAALALLCCSRGFAVVGNLTVDAPKAAGTVRIFAIDPTTGRQIDVPNIALAGNETAAQKATIIRNAINAAAVAQGWTTAVAGATVSINNNAASGLTVNFYPRGTKEKQQSIVAPGNAQFRGGHGDMDPHSPSMSLYSDAPVNSMPALFTAGVDVGGTDYSTTLTGQQIASFNGHPSDTSESGTQISAALYASLTSMSLPSGVVVTNPSGTIDVVFNEPFGTETGILWGTDSPTSDPNQVTIEGYNGALDVVPEPATLVLLAMGAVTVGCGHARVARRRDRP
jgi:PEP-CTERM motif